MSIILDNISKTFNDNTKNKCIILKNINLNIKQGSLTAIKGKSGAGKSTLLHIIGCLDSASEGDYILDGIKINELSDKKIARLRNKTFGYIMQDFGLINDDTVYMNVLIPLLLSDIPFRKIKKITEDCLNQLGIYHLRDKKVEVLSGGEKQRTAIARALVNNPSYILADEPTGSLDSKNADMIMDILIKLNHQGKTVLIITHDDDIAAKCDSIVYIMDGKLKYTL